MGGLPQEMIDNRVLKKHVKNLYATTNWYLESDAFFTSTPSGNTENSLKAINTSHNIVYSSVEYKLLLERVSIVMGEDPQAITSEHFKEIRQADLEVPQVDPIMMTDIFCTIYAALRNLLANAIYNVHHSPARRADDSTTSNPKKIIEINQLLTFSSDTKKLFSTKEKFTQGNKEKEDLEIAKLLSPYGVTSTASWLKSDEMLTVGMRIISAIEIAIMGGNHKCARKEKFET